MRNVNNRQQNSISVFSYFKVFKTFEVNYFGMQLKLIHVIMVTVSTNYLPTVL